MELNRSKHPSELTLTNCNESRRPNQRNTVAASNELHSNYIIRSRIPQSLKSIMVLIFIGLCSTQNLLAQWNFDVVSVEAYIEDHKKQKSLLMARAALEEGNLLLHKYAKEASLDYKDINVEMDKYQRAFDIIDMLYQSLRTALNIYSTADKVTSRVGDYKNLIEDYTQKIVAKKGVALSDTIIVSIAYHSIETLSKDVSNLYHSVTDMVLYVTGAAACSTENLLMLVNELNLCLDTLRADIDNAYFQTWRYIQLRMAYWKQSVYCKHTRWDIVMGAFERWRRVARLGR